MLLIQEDILASQKRVATALYAAMHEARHELEVQQEPTEPIETRIEDKRHIAPDAGPFRDFVFQMGHVVLPTDRATVLSAFYSEPLNSARFHKDNVSRRLISDDEAKSIARRIYNLAGYEGEIDAWSVTDSKDVDLRVQYVATHEKIPYYRNYGGQILVDRLTGKVHGFQAGVEGSSPPRPPLETRPGITAEQARDAALRTTLVDYGGWLEGRPLTETLLCIWKPMDGTGLTGIGRTQFLNAADRRRAEANEGRLVYVTGIEDRSSPQYIDQSYLRSYSVIVDAQSGTILEIERWPEAGGGTGGSTKPSAAARLQWPQGARVWRVASASLGKWRGPVQSSLTPVARGTFKPNRVVNLQSGSIAFRVEFDSEHGLLGLRTATGIKLARPNRALLECLR